MITQFGYAYSGGFPTPGKGTTNLITSLGLQEVLLLHNTLFVIASPLTLRLSDLQPRFVATPLDPLWVGRDFPLGLVLDLPEAQSPSLEDVS